MSFLDQVAASYDEYTADVYGIGKTAFDAKGVVPKKSGKWSNGYMGIHNCPVCCLSSKIFVN
jgi:hypothetical protein